MTSVVVKKWPTDTDSQRGALEAVPAPSARTGDGVGSAADEARCA